MSELNEGRQGVLGAPSSLLRLPKRKPGHTRHDKFGFAKAPQRDGDDAQKGEAKSRYFHDAIRQQSRALVVRRMRET